ncbi:c-type cytochrome biogenesis protein CcsB [Glutamicibacter sp. NPDC087344]|uniref:c-type cytochrome biogenesis protein CcsB n=1 Tax=Glutamicibacter sp. NPDC087344 TaxID=3363994 RepID=UPI00382FDF01
MLLPVNEGLGEVSELLMLSASLIYLMAFIFFAWDMGTLSTLRVTTRSKARAHAGTPQSQVASSAGDAASERDTQPPTKTGKVALGLSVLGFIVHLAAVTTRGVAARRVPWGNLYEYFTTGALVVVTVFLVLLIFKNLRFLGTFIIGIALLMMCAATIGFPTPVGHLVPALQSYWLIIHVSVAVIASALFTVSFALVILQLLKARAEAGGSIRRWIWLERVPSSNELDNLSYRLTTVAFACWTFTLIAGAIWAEQAWGRYWGWDPKEVWTFVIWAVYAGYLHARSTGGWRGTRSAVINIAGFTCIIINSTLVNVFANGLHSYAGLDQ